MHFGVELIHFAVSLGFGLALIFGSRGIARFFASLGHDPDNVPAQQFGIRAILVLVVCVAVVLGLIRFLVG